MPSYALKKAGYWLLDLFLPPQCVCCSKVETWLCEQCASELQTIDGPVCERCGDFLASPGVCQRCIDSPLLVNPIRAVYAFDGSIREVIHALKYRGAESLGPVLGERMAAYWRYTRLVTDAFVPVPLHPNRLRQRGYNQSWILAQNTAAVLNLTASNAWLVRKRDTKSQTHLNQTERKYNVRDAFVCVDPKSIAGKHITLIDDVATTGSTLNACAQALLDKGAAEVNALTLARAC